MNFAFLNLFLYFSAWVTGTTSSSFENMRVVFLQFFSIKDKSDLSLKPPTRASFGRVLSKGGQIIYVASIFFGNLFSDKFFARKIPPKELPIKITLFLKKGIYLSNHIFQSSYLASSWRGIRGLIISKLLPSSLSK